jgi:cyclopropane-fatty-acyl-phospholipid synthase
MNSTDRAKERTLAIPQKLLAGYSSQPFAVRLWDGTIWPAETEQPPRFTLILTHPGALRRMFLPPTELTLGEAYIYGDLNMEGDLIDAFRLADYYRHLELGAADKLWFGRQLLSLPSIHAPQKGRQAARLTGAVHSRERDRRAISYHYDVSNEFYALWLDRRMVYSCGYFARAGDDLDTAQIHKLDHICRKLRLQPGERLLDIGCGWGGLVLYAAQRYCVEAVGITLSQPQVDLARARIREANLDAVHRCRADLMDYREMSPEHPFDKLVSVGMFEHVGQAKLPVYFEQAWRLLRPGGLFLNHGIACPGTEPRPRIRRKSFSNRYVFPDGELTPISTTLAAAEAAGFEVRDVESLREHYALTLRYWVQRLETHHDQALRHVDDVTYRVWRLFISGSAYGFEVGRHNVYQSLLAKPDANGQSGLPLTRATLYAPVDRSWEDRMARQMGNEPMKEAIF